MSVSKDVQAYNPGELIELYELDSTLYGLGVYHFCSSVYDTGSPIVWGGDVYTPLPVKTEGFQKSSQGAAPSPTITLADVGNSIPAYIRANNDLLGAKVTRFRTFKKYLDGQPEADAYAEFPREVYWIERKENQNRFMIRMSLSPISSTHGLILPKRLILKNVCRLLYRTYIGGTFVYPSVGDPGFDSACPYAGISYFTKNGTVTTAPNDECGHTLQDCLLRYPQPNAVPFGGFPGVSRVRG